MPEPVNRTLARGLRMLELLSEHPDGLELNQIARAMQLPKSTAFNLVHTLLDLRYVRLAPEGARYQLGLVMFEVGSAAVNSLDVSQVIRRHMSEIFAQINETVHCGLLAGSEMLYIDKLECTRSIRMTSHVGLRLPLYCTSMGKAVLATMADEQILRLYQGVTFERFTGRTVPDAAALIAQLDRVRLLGYAVEREENNDNVCCVGVAIRGRDGEARYALSVSAPTFRFDGEKEAQYSRLLLRAQAKIERVLKAL